MQQAIDLMGVEMVMSDVPELAAGIPRGCLAQQPVVKCVKSCCLHAEILSFKSDGSSLNN
jgi:hypothetical protein